MEAQTTYDIDLESTECGASYAAATYGTTDDLGAGGAAAGAFIGGVAGLGLAAYAGYSLGDYVNDRYLPDANPLAHVLVDVAGIGAGVSVLGAPFFYGGAAAGAVIGGALSPRVERDIDGA